MSGLWGGQRSPKNWVRRVAASKEALAKKVHATHAIPYTCINILTLTRIRQGSLHLIHGVDVARAILAIHLEFSKSNGERWLLTDGRVYDWWDLASAWGEGPGVTSEPPLPSSTIFGPQPGWVRELMAESGLHALPRPPSAFDRALDSREFWDTFGLSPLKTLMSS